MDSWSDAAERDQFHVLMKWNEDCAFCNHYTPRPAPSCSWYTLRILFLGQRNTTNWWVCGNSIHCCVEQHWNPSSFGKKRLINVVGSAVCPSVWDRSSWTLQYVPIELITVWSFLLRGVIGFVTHNRTEKAGIVNRNIRLFVNCFLFKATIRGLLRKGTQNHLRVTE